MDACPSYDLSTGYISIHGYWLVLLLRYHFGAKSTPAANMYNFKMAFVIILKNHYFRIIIKNLTKCNIFYFCTKKLLEIYQT